MNPEEKKETQIDDGAEQEANEFGKVIDALHSKQKLSSLRTYHGDMAEFIKEKNESTISIALKEKERKEEKEELQPVSKKQTESGFKINFVTLATSLLLLGLGGMAVFYAFNFLRNAAPAPVVMKEEIIPYNNLITLKNINPENFESEFLKIVSVNGTNIVELYGSNGLAIDKAQDFFGLINASLPSALNRNIKERFVLGLLTQNGQSFPFIIISVGDFGQAFSSMLDWEQKMEKDLSFLNPQQEAVTTINPVGITTASTTATIATSATSSATTTTSVKIPMKPDIFVWKDIIVKNKDTRSLANAKNQAKIAYTFLNKNTILITNHLSAIGEISVAYASRAVVR